MTGLHPLEPLLRPARRPLLATAGRGALAAVLVLVTAAVAERVAFRGQVLPGVEVAPATVAGDDERAALADLEALAARLERTPVPARGSGEAFELEPSGIGYEIDPVATVRAARRAGRDRNPVAQVTGTILRRFRPEEVALAATWDEGLLDLVLDRWDDALAAGLENGGLRFEGARVIEIPPRAGYGLERVEAERRVESALRTGDRGVIRLPVGDTEPPVDEAAVQRAASRARRILSAPYTVTIGTSPITVTPEQVGASLIATPDDHRLALGVDPSRLRLAIAPYLAYFETPPVDATWAVDGFTATVVPAAPGRSVDLEPVVDAIFEGRRAVTTTVVETPPALTTEAALALNITEKVSEFTTSYGGGQARVQNIHRAADIANNTVLRPGETFSLNDKLGPRRCELGWVNAPAFSTQEGFYEECGGGVSQFSTTLFNATFFGGYEDLEHTPHTIYISRYPLGREATLNFGSIDNRFRNDSGSGLLIVASHTATSVTVAFYGNREGRVVRAEGPNIIEEIPVAVEYVDNPFLPAGQEQPVPGETGYIGYKVENFRVIERPGQAPVRERFYWEYDMRPRKIYRGTVPA